MPGGGFHAFFVPAYPVSGAAYSHKEPCDPFAAGQNSEEEKLHLNHEERMQILLKPANEPEANAIKSILKENGIHAEIQSYHDTAYDGIFQTQYGWGVLRVQEKDFAEAEKIVEEWRGAAPDELPWDESLKGD
jgi:hypothetical protein